MWWLVWLPIKALTKFTFAVLAAVGSSKTVQPSPSAVPSDSLAQEIPIPTLETEPNVQSADGQAIWDQPPIAQSEEDRLIDRIGDMVDGNGEDAKEGSTGEEENWEREETNIGDISPEERQRQAELPRNPKKRMYEAREVLEHRRDEL
jgi:hypothetical protein